MTTITTLTLLNWQARRAALDASLAAQPAIYTTAAAALRATLTTAGAAYDAAVSGRLVTLGDWQASLAANSAAWGASLLPLYAAAQRAWRTAPGSRFVTPANPDGVSFPLSLTELPAVRAGATLLDNNDDPSVLVAAREPGLWGNTVDVRVVGGTTLEARRGTTVFAATVPAVSSPFTTPAGGGAWGADGIGALLNQPTWAPGALNPPAAAAWAPLTGGAGLVLGRLLAECLGFARAGHGLDRDPAIALAALFFRTPIRLVDVGGGVLRPVPAGVADVSAAPTAAALAGSIGAVLTADEYLRQIDGDAQRFLAALAA